MLVESAKNRVIDIMSLSLMCHQKDKQEKCIRNASSRDASIDKPNEETGIFSGYFPAVGYCGGILQQYWYFLAVGIFSTKGIFKFCSHISQLCSDIAILPRKLSCHLSCHIFFQALIVHVIFLGGTVILTSM